MASIQQRGKTFQYTISHKSLEKPLRKGGFRTKKEAKIAAGEIEAKLNSGVTPYLKPRVFEEYFQYWVDVYKKKVSKATLKHYSYTYDRIKEYFNNTTMQEIDLDRYQEFLNELGKNRSKETVEKVNGHIRQCVHHAVDQGILPRDFTRKAILYYTVEAKEGKDKHINFNDSKHLIKGLKNRLNQDLGFYLLLLGLVTGMRYQELVGLTFKDFNFEENTIEVNKTWGYNKRMELGFGPTKNKESRTIKVGQNTMNLFKDLFEINPDNTNHLVFYNRRSKYKVISNEHVNKLLKEVLLDLKIRPLISMHGLRHTHGSILLYQKASIHYISERLGHKDTDTTIRIYSHLLKEARVKDEKLAVITFENLYE